MNRATCQSAGGRLIELDGVAAALIPQMPDQAVLNNAVYSNSERLRQAIDQLAATYEAAGVNAWIVRVPAGDRGARRLLRLRGHRPVAQTTAMGRHIDGIERPPESALQDWTSTGDPRVMGALCDRVFGFGTAISRAYGGPLPDWVRVYVAYLEGEPASTLLSADHDRNCVIDWVATAPEARRRGLSTALVRHAVADARERGCVTSTLVATPMGKPGYRRLGYREVGLLEQWEWRA